LLAALLSAAAFAQQWPTRPVRIVVPFPPGQAADIIARLVAERLTQPLGYQVIIDNRPGAGGSVGTEMAAKAQADGYTYLAGGSAALAINPHVYRTLGYDTLKDFAPVTTLVVIPMVFVVNPSVPVQNIQDLIKLAKQRPGQVSYGSSGSGSTVHLVQVMFASQAGIELNHVPYKGAVQSLTDLAGGQIMMLVETSPAVLPFVRSGKIRAIGVTTIKRVPQLPDVPTVDEQGIKGFDYLTWTSLVAPARTPEAILERMNREVTKIIHTPEVSRKLEELAFIPLGNSRAQFGAFLKAEYAKWGKAVTMSGAKVD
jgi:tripartite-type tricarboxylate transporter receptor subunit TctC